MNTLVFGAPGSGKTTWAIAHRNRIGGLIYDLDLIAAALIGETGPGFPHPVHEDAREIANQMLTPIIAAARRCGANLTVIRAAPTIEEVTALSPDLVVWIRSDAAERSMGPWAEKRLAPTIRIIEQMGYAVDEVRGR